MDERQVLGEGVEETLNRLSDLCLETAETARAFGNRTRWYPSPDSPYEAERAGLSRKVGPGGDWDDTPARGLVTFAATFLPAASQYLLGMAALLARHEVIFPLAPVARSFFEIAGRVSWLLDPRIEARDRAARYYLIWVDDLTRSKTLAKAFNDLKQQSELGERLHRLRKSEIPGRFYPSEIVRTKRGDLILRGNHMPGLRESVHLLDEIHGEPWNAQGLYVFLSASSHPTLRTIVEMMDREELVEVSQNRPQDPIATIELNFRLPDLYYPVTLTRNALLTYIQTWRLMAAYHGLACPEADEQADRVDRETTLESS